MALYSTGTVAVTNGSATVTGTGTDWFGTLQAGWMFTGPDGRVYGIANVVNNTSLTLTRNYQGSTASAQDYECFPTQSLAGDLAASFGAILTSFQGMIDTVGASKIPAGDDWVWENDPDTGLKRTASNTLALLAGGNNALVISGASASGSAVESSGKLMAEGAFGLGATGSESQNIGDWQATDRPSGTYIFSSGTANSEERPTGYGAYDFGVVTLRRYSATHFSVDTVRMPGGTNVSPYPQTRRYNNGTWSDWAPLTPSSGSNANGSWVRLSDGTQICWNSSAITTDPAAFTGTAVSIDGGKMKIGKWY